MSVLLSSAWLCSLLAASTLIFPSSLHSWLLSTSMFYYIFQGGTKVFAIGYGLQLSLRILMQMRKIARRPVLLLRALKSSDTFSLGAFLGGFSFLYRVSTMYVNMQVQKGRFYFNNSCFSSYLVC